MSKPLPITTLRELKRLYDELGYTVLCEDGTLKAIYDVNGNVVIG